MLLNVTRRFSYRAIRSYTTTKPHGPSELLWGSDGAQTRISQLKSAAGETLSPFPSVFYPCIDTQQGKTLVRDFVQTYKELDNTQLHVYQSRKTTLNGRIKAIRKHGSKLLFLQVEQDESHVQIFCNFGAVEDQENWKRFASLIHEGDHFAFKGFPTRTSTGELSLKVTSVPTMLAPRLHVIPEQVTDEQTLARFPQLDLMMHRGKRNLLRTRAQVERVIQNFFDQRGFVKVSTPILAASTGGAVAQPFVTHAHRLDHQPLTLRISQELDLKKLIVAGMDHIYEIGPNFRNEGIDATHNPEFTTCEFYEAYASLEDLISTTEDLFKAFLESKNFIKVPAGFEDGNFCFRQLEFLPTLEKQIQEKYPSFEMPALSSSEAYNKLADVANKLGIQISKPTDEQLLPHILDTLSSHLIEPLCVEPTFITDYPAIMSPLAKSSLSPETSQRIARRAELFINGTEYANLYEEENDPYQQTKNFLQQASYNDATSKAVDLDAPYEDLFQQLSPSQKYYIRVLELGLPPTGGWGCGIDRLVMLFGGASRIGDVLPFGNLRNVVAMGT